MVKLNFTAKAAPEGDRLTREQVDAVHQGLRILAGECDGACDRDDTGFNSADAHFGHQLARQSSLSNGQALAARKMLRKYHRQIGQELIQQMWM